MSSLSPHLSPSFSFLKSGIHNNFFKSFAEHTDISTCLWFYYAYWLDNIKFSLEEKIYNPQNVFNFCVVNKCKEDYENARENLEDRENKCKSL